MSTFALTNCLEAKHTTNIAETDTELQKTIAHFE